MIPTDSPLQPFGLAWLIRLRWLAALGQVATCVGAVVLFNVALPVAVLGACVLVTLATNAWAARRRRGDRTVPTALPAALVMLDTVTLTVMLFWTGGAQSPFTVFYLLHVTIAAMLLAPPLAWASVALAAAGYGVLSLSPIALRTADGPLLGEAGAADRQGTLVALLVAGGFLAFFVGKLRAELARREAELVGARLRQARDERFASLATLAAGVAHELATPLATIAVIAREIEDGGDAPDGAAAAVADARLIRGEVERCRGVLTRLSDQTTNGSGDEVVALPLGELPARLAPYSGPDILRRVAFDISEPERAIVVPAEALLQALAVVLKNGVEASEPSAGVRLRVWMDAAEAYFEVSDHGAGMSPAVRARAGEPFFTTKEPGRGMGLGLFLVRMFVERVRGRLEIESAAGAGTTVRLVVPAPEGGAA